MKIKKIPIPEIYKSSADFRFFIDWFATALEKIQYDTENLADIYDPLRCPEDLLWCLADTMGYKYDDRLPTAFNRLVLLYFMSMIYNRGSRNGMILAAETNLAQFHILEEAEQDDIKYNRLEDTSIPTNAVSVVAHTVEGFIDIVYFSTELPKDACIEYVRPIGMYAFQRAGVVFDNINTKLTVDAELTNFTDTQLTFGPTQVGHYRRADYASLQKMLQQTHTITTRPGSEYPYETINYVDKMPDPENPGEYITLSEADRHKTWYRNVAYESSDSELSDGPANAGFRALHSLQLANNEHIVKSLIPPIFTIGETPLAVGEMSKADDYYKIPEKNPYNLRYDITTDEQYTRKASANEYAFYTIDKERSPRTANTPIPVPAVNPPMAKMGDALSKNETNSEYYPNPNNQT